MKNKGQASVEYMIIVGFVTFAVIIILGMAYFYSGMIKDKLRGSQIESFGSQLVNSAESVFFSGEPSKTAIRLYLPENIDDIQINSDGVVITFSLSSGTNIREFESRVPLQGEISDSPGVKVISVEAKNNYVLLSVN